LASGSHLAQPFSSALDFSNASSHTDEVKDEPPSPPIVHVGDEIIAYLLAWERHERDGS